MEAKKRVLKLQVYNLKKAMLSLWSVILVINIFSYISTIYFYPSVQFGVYLDDELVSITGFNLIIIAIFFIVYGIIMYHENFRLAFSFGSTRKDFYISVLVINSISALIFSTIQLLIQIIDKIVIKYVGLKPLFLDMHQNPVVNFILSVLTIFGILLIISAIINIVGILQYQFTYKFWIGLGITLIVSFVLFRAWPIKLALKILDIYLFLSPIFRAYTIFIMTVFLSIPFYIIGYFLFRKTNVQ